MSKGSSPSSIMSTQSNEPSDFIRPYLEQAMDYNQDLFESSSPVLTTPFGSINII